MALARASWVLVNATQNKCICKSIAGGIISSNFNPSKILFRRYQQYYRRAS